jgi:hypothetical protein
MVGTYNYFTFVFHDHMQRESLTVANRRRLSFLCKVLRSVASESSELAKRHTASHSSNESTCRLHVVRSNSDRLMADRSSSSCWSLRSAATRAPLAARIAAGGSRCDAALPAAGENSPARTACELRPVAAHRLGSVPRRVGGATGELSPVLGGCGTPSAARPMAN